MTLTSSPTELTTGATDAILAIECLFILIFLWRTPTNDRWKRGLWCWVFGLLAFVSVLGALTHGLAMSESLRVMLWRPLYLSLGLIVGLFLVGAVYDWRGLAAARRLVPWSVGLGIIFFMVTEIFSDAFIIFVLYEAVAMTVSLMIYSYLAVSNRLKGANIVATAVFLNLLAAGVQASNLSFTLVVPFDHNGVFHLIQMVALAALGLGLHMGILNQHFEAVPKSAGRRSSS
jgi:hypothetical protein